MATSKGRGPYAKTAGQRLNILSAARRSFSQHGYHGSSMRGIADGAGLTFTGLRHHFPTKDELLIAVLEQRDAEHRAQQTDFHGADLLDALVALLDDVLDEPAITEVFTTLSGEAVNRDHPAHAFFVERYARIRQHFADELRPPPAGGDVTTSSEHAALLLTAAMDGLQLQFLLDDAVDARGAFAELVRLLRGPQP